MTGHLELFVDLSEVAKNTQVMIEKKKLKRACIRNANRRIRIICKII